MAVTLADLLGGLQTVGSSEGQTSSKSVALDAEDFLEAFRLCVALRAVCSISLGRSFDYLVFRGLGQVMICYIGRCGSEELQLIF